ncbi:MAG: hypothetical protein A2252_05965 [Elusimicrobia bacterium RIFOXYA2_FULL_39_19]|nr:MAG: hypothetical protein A2252_05965 [Elusimicrobia bacterium RIFOXYA2_FULL_39_19]
MDNKRYTNIFYVIVIVIAGVLVYINTVNKSFFWDDEVLIANNVHIRSFSNIPYFFNPGYANVYEQAGGERYRPLRTVTFVFDYMFWKENAAGYHITNITMHIIVALILFFMVKTMTKNNLAAFLSGLVFVLHPVHTESVVYIKNRSDILCAIFFILSFMFYVKYISKEGRPEKVGNPGLRKDVIYYAASIFVFILALVSKEMAITLPFILAGYIIFLKRDNIKMNFILTIPYFAVLAVYFGFRKFIMKSTYASADISSINDRIFVVLHTVGGYTKLLILPLNLCADRTLVITRNLFSLEVILAILTLFILIPFIIIKRNELNFWLFFLLFTLIPASNLVFLAGRPFAEQRLYLPSIGFSVFLGILLAKIKNYKAVLGTVLSVIILTAYSSATIARNFDWKNEEVLWEKTVKTNPVSARAHHNLAVVYGKKGRYGEAIEQLNKSLQLDNKFFDSYNTLGWVYFKMKLYKESIKTFEKGLEIAPANYEMAANLGGLYNITGEYAKAERLYKEIIRQYPWMYRSYYNLAVSYMVTNRKQEAINYFYKTIELNPYYKEAYGKLYEIYTKENNTVEMERLKQTAEKFKVNI